MAKELGLRRALSSGLYPSFKGPAESTCPVESSSLDFLKLAMCEVIAVGTNRYAEAN